MGVQILHLLFGDLAQLRRRHLAHETPTGRLCALLDARRLQQEVAGRRRLGHKSERAIGEAGDDYRNRHPRLQALRRRVELLAKCHDVQAALTQRWTHRGRWIGLARRNLQLDIAFDLLRHFLNPLSYWDRAVRRWHASRTSWSRAPPAAASLKPSPPASIRVRQVWPDRRSKRRP